ncbi:MAG: hypothetical protein ABSA11_09540 [Candidatus Bathyarchaeia archaeon]|jgi:hypothetical protein
MSHLICPLCGLNVPLSKLERGNFPIDLKTISFRNLGYRKGFGVSEIVSIMGDGEITPIIAARVKKLHDYFVEHGEIDTPLRLINESHLKQCNEYEEQLSKSNTYNMSLKTKLEKIEEEYEQDRQVDYIIRESLSIDNARQQLIVDEHGWKLTISPKPGQLEFYLFLLMLDIPGLLKERLLNHIEGGENRVFYNRMLKSFPRRQSVAERRMDYDNPNTIITMDENGKRVERIYKSRYYLNNADKSIDFEELRRLVRKAKEHSTEPLYIGKTLLEVMYPEKLSLTYRVEDSK